MSIENLSINTIRTLSIDSIEKANSGHPGMPMGAAPMAYSLWTNFLTVSPKNPTWINRDRFVLSAGHGSMLLYSLLHLSKFNITMDDLKNFRQWGSKTPGHPEYGHTEGVDATTGPLGQGISMAVGMAMAERHLAATYNKDSYPIIDHYTYSICGDGDLMEGVSHEAASLAGHLKLGRLIVLYDSNDISLDGDLHMSFSESVMDRYQSYGWQVILVEDGNDIDAIQKAIEEAKQETNKPTLIEVKTTIGYGSPNKSGKSASHGSPLGEEEVTLTKAHYKWEHEPFCVPNEVYEDFEEKVMKRGNQEEEKWNAMFKKYEKEFPELARQFKEAVEGILPEKFEEHLPIFDVGEKLATREASSQTIQAISEVVPQFFGGSADLASSNKTLMKQEKDFLPGQYEGRNVWFGVREFAMGTAINGMALHGGIKPFGATFFVFSDYVRPAIRLSALMNVPAMYVFTHDSIAVGEDGPTHEPIEHLASLRAMPNLSVIRPADANETVAAWRLALESKNTPHALVLTRQGLPTIEGTKERAYEGVKKGAYVISQSKESPEALLLATGSEVSLAIAAQKELEKENIFVNVISMPSWDRFDCQTAEYKERVLPRSITKRLGIEMGSSLGFHKYVGLDGELLTIDRFGASAPGNKVMEEYGFTVTNVIQKVKAMLKK